MFHQSIKASRRASARLQTCQERGACQRRRCRSLLTCKQRQRQETDYFLTTLDCLSVETQESHELRRCVSSLHVFLPLLFTVAHMSPDRRSPANLQAFTSLPEDEGQIRGQTCVRPSDVHPQQPDWLLPW